MHLDTENGQGDALSQVLIISKMIWEKKNICGWRVAVICYTRHSITNYFKRKDETIGPAVNHVINEYSKFCESRRCILALKRILGKQKMIMSVSQKPFCEVGCHMNPAVFLSPVVFHIHQLVCQHSLNFMEVISLLCAWVALQWTPCYFCTVCDKMMSTNGLQVRGIFIGHYVLEKIFCMYDHRNKDAKLTHPGKRFFDYRNVSVPDKDEWCESVEKIVYVTLQSFRNNIKPSSKKKCLEIYKDTFNYIKAEIPGAGILKVNHLMGAMAIIGVLPLWYIGSFHHVHETQGIKHLVELFKLKTGKGPTQTLMNALIQALSI